MSIIGALPVTLANGNTADASQVMTNLNFIINAVNANAQPAGSYVAPGTLPAPSGTRMAFHQAAAPTGWVSDTTIGNHAVIISSSGGAVQSGQQNFGALLTGSVSTGGHTLTASEIPPHTHVLPGASGQYNSSGNPGFFTTATSSSPFNITTDGGTGGNQPHSHQLTTQYNYVVMVIAQKS
ncbi:hypothetical protein B0G75_104281 [Paraburkholderia sp. BL18I3N2]|uniref:hypothetical protein n=1 Tax=Paraburkholderia sp. BL18I3N2 TaxID=1938799 RepID=UPI000D059E6C|nr:hypothetical protein [Paraburkholderia sp. BL18I3N2]PRX32260.1 hypothetical protein B0G75_104281 [Paraburkholderia sp. BL18I3N2]